MAVYLFSIIPDGHRELTLSDDISFDDCNCLRWSGESKANDWKAIELKWLEDDFTDDSDRDADFLKFSGAVVVSERAYSILKDRLEGFVEFLPVKIDGGTRYVLNVVRVLDIMDKEKSKYKIHGSGRIGMCEHAFINGPDSKEMIYQVAGFLGRIFIGDDLKALIESNSLTGALIREYRNP